MRGQYKITGAYRYVRGPATEGRPRLVWLCPDRLRRPDRDHNRDRFPDLRLRASRQHSAHYQRHRQLRRSLRDQRSSGMTMTARTVTVEFQVLAESDEAAAARVDEELSAQSLTYTIRGVDLD
jgi:hypothetical protein